MRHCQLKRYNKIFTEKFYLLDIDTSPENHYLINISGSTFNVYNLKFYHISKKIYCNCPDAKKWAEIQGCSCKHICFAFHKIFGLTQEEIENYNFHGITPDLYDKCEDKIKNISFQTDPSNDLINDQLIAKFNELKTEKEPKKDIFKTDEKKVSDDCPICYDKLEENILKCPSCNNLMHKECMEMWLNSNQDTCPYCRSKVWTKYLNKDNGQYYLNLL
jgi:hypothetical protein